MLCRANAPIFVEFGLTRSFLKDTDLNRLFMADQRMFDAQNPG